MSKGSELQFAAAPVAHWNISGSVAYTDAKLVSAAAGTGISSGDELPLVSRLSWAITSDYDFPLVSGLSGVAHLGVDRVGSRWDTYASANPYTREMPGYIVTNVRLGVSGEHWMAAIYATNLFDSYIINYTTPRRAAPYDVLALPRVIGINARYSF